LIPSPLLNSGLPLLGESVVGRKTDLRRVDEVAREFEIDRIEFGDYLH